MIISATRGDWPASFPMATAAFRWIPGELSDSKFFSKDRISSCSRDSTDSGRDAKSATD